MINTLRTMGNLRLAYDDAGLGIPYPSKAPSSGNHGYKDLKKNPHIIDQIPELKSCRELRQLVKSANSFTSIFRTLGCDKWVNAPEKPGRPYLDGCYIDLAFELLDWNTEKAWTSAYDAFVAHSLHLRFSAPCEVEFQMHRTSFNDHIVGDSVRLGVTPAIYIVGNGVSRTHAKKGFMAGVGLFESFLFAQNEKYREHLNTSKVRIS